VSETRTGLALQRVLVAIEPPNLSAQSLAAVRELAHSLQLEVAGLFVEDLNLLRLAALPIAREVGAVSGMVRAIEVSDVERALRAQAEQMRRTLSSVAAELDLPWSFRVERGELLERVLAQLSETVAVVFAPAPRKAPIGMTSRAGAGMPSPHKALAILDPTPAGDRALSVAQWLSRAPGATLTVASVTTEKTALGAGHETARSRSPGRQTDTRVVRLPDTSVDALVDAARITACDMLVLGSEVFPRQQREFRALLQRVRCLVMVVG
jgi:hypothetical protein